MWVASNHDRRGEAGDGSSGISAAVAAYQARFRCFTGVDGMPNRRKAYANVTADGGATLGIAGSTASDGTPADELYQCTDWLSRFRNISESRGRGAVRGVVQAPAPTLTG